MLSFSDPLFWAENQFGEAYLADSRRTKRAIKLGEAIASRSGVSLPNQTANWNDLRGAYRLLNEEAVSHKRLCLPHWQTTREKTGKEVALMIQDTSTLDYTGHKATKGLGYTGTKESRGLLVHSYLTVIPDENNPEILGLSNQLVWAREEKYRPYEKRSDRSKRRTEAAVWQETLQAIGIMPKEKNWVSVGDRGSDVFEYISTAQKMNWHCLLRVTQDRNIVCANGQKEHLKHYLRSFPSQAEKLTILRGRDGGIKRKITLQISWAEIMLLSPKARKKQPPIKGYCFRCWNEKEGLEWLLFSTVPFDEHDALEQISWYEHRWLIEEFHKCLKTGCAIEKRQLRKVKAMMTLIGFLSLAAVRLLQLRNLARTKPELKALKAGAELLFVKLVAMRLKQKVNTLSLGQFWKGVAMFGGFIGRNSDGEPGWQTLWKGWERLQDICYGAEWSLNQK